MHTMKSIAIGWVVVVSALNVQAQSDDRYRISLTIDGQTIEGSQQRTLRLAGKSREEQIAILSEPMQRLQTVRGSQLVVTVTDPSGTTTDYTGTTRLAYETFDCLAVSSSGVLRVAPTRSCSGPDFPELWIIFKDGKGTPLAINEYHFTTLSSPQSGNAAVGRARSAGQVPDASRSPGKGK